VYHPEDEYGIRWNDPRIEIEWGSGDKLISEKDNILPQLKDMDQSLLPRYQKDA